MQAIVTNEITGGQTQQHLELGGSETIATPVYKGSQAVPAPALPKLTPFTEVDLTNSVSNQSTDIRETRAARPDATLAESVSAAIQTWDTTRLIKRAFRPKFTGEKINKAEYLDEVGVVLDESEYDYFNSIGDTLAGANYAMGVIKDTRKAYEVMGDHPAAAGITAVLDPVWMGIPPAWKIASIAGKSERLVSGAIGGGVAGGITYGKDGPMTDGELALNMLSNAGAAALFFNPKTSKIEKVDPSHPSEAAYRMVRQMAERRTDVEGLSPSLQPGAVDRPNLVGELDSAIEADQKKRGLGEKLQWNVRKTISNFGTGGKRVADLIFDNNSDLSKHSMESHRASILTELNYHKHGVDDKIMEILGKQGYDHGTMLYKPRATYEAQAEIERQTMHELYRREQLTRQGIDYRLGNVDKDISELADRVDAFHRRALQEQKAAGVNGAENVDFKDGFVHRVWDARRLEDAISQFVRAGKSRTQAVTSINRMIAGSLRRANPNWEEELSHEIAGAITQRALAKGQFEDSLFNGLIDNSQLEQLKQVMRDGGMRPENIEKAINRIKYNQDDAGKAGHLKHRVDLDYTAVHREAGVDVRLVDLLDNRLIDHLERYGKSSATEAAFARVGLRAQSDIDALRKELLESTEFAKREEAARMFDDSIAYFKGMPSGVRMNDNMRLLQTYGRSIALSWAGLWQMADFATMFAKHGMLKTIRMATKEIPGFKGLQQEIKDSPETARSLHNVLSSHSDANLRLRPFMHRLEDGYDLDFGNTAQLAGQAGGQLVSRVNGLKFVHSKQSKIAANLIIDRLDQAGRGNSKALDALSKFGLKRDVVEKVSEQINRHGYNVDAWDDAVWANTRPALHKMMDELVLQSRAGDMPAFMMFDNLGKFLGTYRNFTFTAHNKLMGGRLERDGSMAVSQMLLYQMPLSYLAVAAQSAVMGKDESEEQIASKALGMMGGLGLLAEPMNWALGNSNEFGTPGTIPVDRLIKLGQDPSLTNAMNATPLAAANPLWKALGAHYKED